MGANCLSCSSTAGSEKDLEFLDQDLSATKSRQIELFALDFKSCKRQKTVNNINDRYQFGRLLGAGSFGAVYEATTLGGVSVAIKKLSREEFENSSTNSEVLKKLLMNEMQVLQDTDHPYFTRIFEILEDADFFYVVMELLSADLHTYLS